MVMENIITCPDLKGPFPIRGLGEELFESLKKHGDQVAQISVETGVQVSYKNLLDKCIRTAKAIKHHGISSQDIVGMVSSNHLDICVPFIASQFLAVPFVSWDPMDSTSRLAAAFKLVPLKFLFVSPEYLSKVKQALENCSAKPTIIVFGDDLKYTSFEEFIAKFTADDDFQVNQILDNRQTACIIFTSGTTGEPRGVCISHQALLRQTAYIRHHENIDMDLIKRETPRVSLPYKILSYIPLYWISTYAAVVNIFLYGACLVVWSDFDANEFLQVIEKYNILNTYIGLYHLSLLMKVGRPKDLKITSPLRITIAGSIIPANQILRLRELIPEADVYQSYGLTEVTGIVTLFQTLNKDHRRFFKEKPGSCGLPVPGSSYKIVDPDSEQILGSNATGELRVKSELIMNGYYKADSSEAFDKDGWFKTGDIAYYDEDYCFYIVDRVKDQFRFQTVNVQPATIERELLSHSAVKLATVVGIPHESDTCHAMGIVVLREGESLLPEELLEYINSRLDYNHKIRAGIKILPSMPTTKTGKIRRKDVRDMVLGGKL